LKGLLSFDIWVYFPDEFELYYPTLINKEKFLEKGFSVDRDLSKGAVNSDSLKHLISEIAEEILAAFGINMAFDELDNHFKYDEHTKQFLNFYQ
jgi:hypothetical protein